MAVAKPNLIASDQQSPPCQLGCGACCIAPAISSPIPGMPHGKPAGVRCVQLDDQQACRLFGCATRPAVCAQFMPQAGLCDATREHALQQLTQLERATAPAQLPA